MNNLVIMSKDMKFLIAGNLANNGYNLARLLRKKGFLADLLTNKSSKKYDDPKAFDENLKEYPDWIKFWDNSKWNWKYEIIRMMRKYDLIQASTELPIFSLISAKPYVVFTTGSDIIELAHKNSIKGFFLREAYKKAKVLIFSGPYMYPSIVKLNLKKALFLPLLWDYEKFSPSEKKSDDETKFTIFHPTGHRWDQKRNDIFLRAFIRLANERNNVRLIMVKNGPDFQKSKKILEQKNLRGKLTIIPNPIPQKNMKFYYDQADVVVDQFVVGSTGLIGQEAMACEKPLIQFVNEELYQKFYPEVPPIMNASTEKQIYEKLVQLIEDRSLGRKLGKKSREWLLKYHDVEKIIKKYICVYHSVYNKMNFEKITEGLKSI